MIWILFCYKYSIFSLSDNKLSISLLFKWLMVDGRWSMHVSVYKSNPLLSTIFQDSSMQLRTLWVFFLLLLILFILVHIFSLVHPDPKVTKVKCMYYLQRNKKNKAGKKILSKTCSLFKKIKSHFEFFMLFLASISNRI